MKIIQYQFAKALSSTFSVVDSTLELKWSIIF